MICRHAHTYNVRLPLCHSGSEEKETEFTRANIVTFYVAKHGCINSLLAHVSAMTVNCIGCFPEQQLQMVGG